MQKVEVFRQTVCCKFPKDDIMATSANNFNFATKRSSQTYFDESNFYDRLKCGAGKTIAPCFVCNDATR